MLDLEKLYQLVCFAKAGTLSAAADELHVSQPTLTRSMKLLEEEMGLVLFSRQKNKITLTETGKETVRRAAALLESAASMEKDIRAYDRSLRTITIESVAPAPLWFIVPEITKSFEGWMISSCLEQEDTIMSHASQGSVSIGIIRTVPPENFTAVPYFTEHLSICLPKNHPMLNNRPSTVTFHDINGYNCLLKSQLGFWDALCREKMPASRFLIQDDEYTFLEIAEHSTLPFFATNVTSKMSPALKDRIVLPVTGKEANVTYYLIAGNKNLTKSRLRQLAQNSQPQN